MQFRVEEDDDDDTTPWKNMKEVMGKKANWPCWTYERRRSTNRTRVCVVSETSRQMDAFEKRLYKERVKEKAQAMKEKEDRLESFGICLKMGIFA